MTSKEKHKKHGNTQRASLGKFGRNEVAILGTTCEEIQQLVNDIRLALPTFNIAYVDADHSHDLSSFQGTHLQTKSNHFQLSFKGNVDEHERKIHLSQADLIVVNGNHFEAKNQIIIGNEDKQDSLRKRAGQLTNVCAIITKENQPTTLEYIQELVPNEHAVIKLSLSSFKDIIRFVENTFLKPPPLKALILAGGKSVRMGRDKALIIHHDMPQFLHLKKVLDELEIESSVSCRADQKSFFEEQGCSVIEDKIINMGPLGAIISAFMQFPDNACLVVACDIPKLDKEVLLELIASRNASSIATCFQSPFDELPEPLVTVWEPKSYARMLAFVAQGYDCPRKVLINSGTTILKPSQPEKLTNVNTQEDLSLLFKHKIK